MAQFAGAVNQVPPNSTRTPSQLRMAAMNFRQSAMAAPRWWQRCLYACLCQRQRGWLVGNQRRHGARRARGRPIVAGSFYVLCALPLLPEFRKSAHATTCPDA